MKEQTREDPKILAAAERQMQAWVLRQEIADRAVRIRGLPEPAECEVKFVTISREFGAGGSEIGEGLARRLGWEVLDRDLLERMYDRFHVSRKMLEAVDETEASWVYDVLGTWVDQSAVGHEKYVAQLGKVVAAAARRQGRRPGRLRRPVRLHSRVRGAQRRGQPRLRPLRRPHPGAGAVVEELRVTP